MTVNVITFHRWLFSSEFQDSHGGESWKNSLELQEAVKNAEVRIQRVVRRREREKIGFSTLFYPNFKEISENMSVEKINKCQEAIEIP